ncbi:hypothetical protein [Rhizobium leguminosarum]|uniref:hypothetical protein n=1 Tax=Rhizobium leguminosarum TaxID=384 RepID=UPI003F99D92A
MSDSSSRIEIDTVDFQLSCRRFTIRATITRDRQLPVVDEFVLRLLAVVDRMSAAKMRAWFGFSEREMETVILDMSRRNLIEFVHDDVQLAPAGRDLFRTATESGVPHVVEVAPLVENVWFDLVSRNMVPASRARAGDYLLKVAEQPGAREMPEQFARAAFEENFRDYARRIRRFPDPDAVNLYSISDIEGGIYGHQILRAGLVLDMDRLLVRPIFPDLSAANYGKLTVAASGAWGMTAGADPTSATSAEMERMTGDSRLSEVIGDPGSMDLWRDALADLPRLGDGFKPTVGAPHLPRNLDQLLTAVAEFKGTDERCDIIWLRPNGSTWGRTQRVGEALVSIADALRNAGMTNIKTTIAMPRSAGKSVRMSHKRLFNRGLLLPQGHLPGNLEVLAVGGVVAFVNAHLPVGAHSVPIGGLVFNGKRLARIVERLTPGTGDGWEQLWDVQPTKLDEDV